MSALTKELKNHVDAVILNASQRRSMLRPLELIPMLEGRIQAAEDKGLVGVVFWHGKWFNYSQALSMLDYLRSCET